MFVLRNRKQNKNPKSFVKNGFVYLLQNMLFGLKD